MRIYEYKPQFNPDTGEPCGHREKLAEHRCDFCGRVIAQSEYSDAAQGYRPEYFDRDPCYRSCGTEFELCEQFKLTDAIYYDDPYIFCCDANADDMPRERETYDRCELLMVQEWLKNIEAGEGPFADCDSIDMVWREARTRAMRKLLESGELKPWQIDTNCYPAEEETPKPAPKKRRNRA